MIEIGKELAVGAVKSLFTLSLSEDLFDIAITGARYIINY